MGRAPCCEKMGLKKGPWTPDEDQILVNYIQKFGHGNWRALPKQAGLLRCGKSCRLRWINYLCPDIKRGNFSKEEEETIIHLHEILGNKWSAIAGKLPGRTDNEIKNVWHTHLKKRLNNYDQQNKAQKDNNSSNKARKRRRVNDQISMKKESKSESESGLEPVIHGNNDAVVATSAAAAAPLPQTDEPFSPQQSNSSSGTEISSLTANTTTTATASSGDDHNNYSSSMDNYFEDFSGIIDEGFLSEVLSENNSGIFVDGSPNSMIMDNNVSLSSSSIMGNNVDGFSSCGFGSNHIEGDDNMDFWLNLLTRSGDFPELLHI